jgi:hypothetical protein
MSSLVLPLRLAESRQLRRLCFHNHNPSSVVGKEDCNHRCKFRQEHDRHDREECDCREADQASSNDRLNRIRRHSFRRSRHHKMKQLELVLNIRIHCCQCCLDVHQHLKPFRLHDREAVRLELRHNRNCLQVDRNRRMKQLELV